MLIYWLALLAPSSLLLVAWHAFRHPGCRDSRAPLISEFAALGSLAVALGSLALLLMTGPGTSPVIGVLGLGIAIRIDALSVTMLLLVAFVGWVVLRFARTCMDGDAAQGRFTGWLCITRLANLQ